jgi:hypothetical protein
MTHAQVITLNDSVIFADAKPAAFYISQPNSFSTLPNTDIFTLEGNYAIEAVLFEFAAPVRELKAFHYYQLRFPATGDTLSIFYEGNDFTRHLAEQAIKYQLLPGKDEKANKAAVNKFRGEYEGIALLDKKLEEIKSFLNYTRAFNLQVVRDRTKPVTLLNNRRIMQDDVMIGTINLAKDLTQTNAALQSPNQRARPGGMGTFSTISTTDYETRIKNEAEIFFLNGVQVKTLSLSDHYTNINNKKEIGYGLFSISKKKSYDVGEGDDFLIRFLCFLVEDHRL